MPKRKIGGYRYREIISRGRRATRQQRDLICTILENGPSQAELFQILTALALLSSTIDDTFGDLDSYREDR